MSVITRINNYDAGTLAKGSDIVADLDNIIADYNGNIDLTNLETTIAANLTALTDGSNISLHTHNLNVGAVDVLATSAEINQALQGISGTVTAANLGSVTSGGQTTVHTHTLQYGAVDVTNNAPALNTMIDSNNLFSPCGFPFVKTNLVVSMTSVPCLVSGLPSVSEVPIPYAGSLIAVGLSLSQAITAGSITIKPTINSVELGQSLVLTGAGQFLTLLINKDVFPFSIGDRVGATITTNATLAPTGIDALVSIYVEV